MTSPDHAKAKTLDSALCALVGETGEADLRRAMLAEALKAAREEGRALATSAAPQDQEKAREILTHLLSPFPDALPPVATEVEYLADELATAREEGRREGATTLAQAIVACGHYDTCAHALSKEYECSCPFGMAAAVLRALATKPEKTEVGRGE